MKKKSFAGLMLALSISLTSVCSLAAEPGAPILLNQRTLFYEQNAPVTINGRTLVPVDKFFSFAGIRANYYENEKKIIVDSTDNKKRIALFLDDPVMQVYTYQTILQAERKDITLDTAPQLVNDTVMCPLRAVLEELGIEVIWDDTAHTITINTQTPAKSEEVPVLKLYTEASDVNTGDIVDVYIMLSNHDKFKDKYNLSAITNTISYDTSEFSFISCDFIPDNPSLVGINAVNANYNNYGIKSVALTNNYPLEADEIKCAKVSFEALTDNGGSFALSDKFNTLRGADNEILFQDSEYNSLAISDVTSIVLDTAPIIIK